MTSSSTALAFYYTPTGVQKPKFGFKLPAAGTYTDTGNIGILLGEEIA